MKLQHQAGTNWQQGKLVETWTLPALFCAFQPSKTSMTSLAKSLVQRQTQPEELGSRWISALSKSKASLCTTKGRGVLEYTAINGD